MKEHHAFRRASSTMAGSALLVFSGLMMPSADAALSTPLGILDLNSTNPSTGVPWAAGDTYRLIYITTATTTAIAPSIDVYNNFVQADAANQGMAGATWKAMASTTTADAIDNVGTISSPIVNAFNSSSVAVDSADLWDLDWNGTNNISTIAGTNANVWFGTTTGGTSFLNGELGAGDGGARIEWSGWGSWDGVYREEPTSSEFALVGISEELTVIPETSAFALLGIGAGMALIRRRRK